MDRIRLGRLERHRPLLQRCGMLPHSHVPSRRSTPSSPGWRRASDMARSSPARSFRWSTPSMRLRSVTSMCSTRSASSASSKAHRKSHAGGQTWPFGARSDPPWIRTTIHSLRPFSRIGGRTCRADGERDCRGGIAAAKRDVIERRALRPPHPGPWLIMLITPPRPPPARVEHSSPFGAWFTLGRRNIAGARTKPREPGAGRSIA